MWNNCKATQEPYSLIIIHQRYQLENLLWWYCKLQDREATDVSSWLMVVLFQVFNGLENH